MNQAVALSFALAALIAVIIIFGCGNNPAEPDYNPVINPAEFVAQVDNPFFPLTPGTTFHYRGQTDEGTETNKVSVTHDTKHIIGVTCVVVADSVWLNGELIEATFDWYAQHQDGTVWYFGEDVDNFENGVLVDHDGSWEAGVDDAKPGIIMEANPQVGDIYRQEFYKGKAEDMAEVLSRNESVTVPFGAFQNCLKTKDWTPLEPGIEANKYYAAGVGFVLEIYTKGSSERVELINVISE
jgi:hypothetical protein